MQCNTVLSEGNAPIPLIETIEPPGYMPLCFGLPIEVILVRKRHLTSEQPAPLLKARTYGGDLGHLTEPSPTGTIQHMLKLNACALLAGFALLSAAPGQDSKSSIAARVNDQIITWADVEAQYIKLDPEKKEPDLRASVLRNMVVKELFLQEAKRKNVQVTKEELDKAIEKEMRSFKTEDDFNKFIARTYRTKHLYRETKEIDMIMMKLISYKYYEWIQKPGTEAPALQEFVTPAEMRRHYEDRKDEFVRKESVSFLRIAIQFNDSNKAEKKTRAESILRHLKEGDEFSVLAQVYSDLKDEKAIFVRDYKREDQFLSDEIEAVLFDTLKKGDLSDVLPLENSWNIFKLVDRVKQEERKFEDEQVQKQIRTELEHLKRDANRRLLVRDLLKRSYIMPADLAKEIEK